MNVKHCAKELDREEGREGGTKKKKECFDLRLW
jgi:hypothetical protein